MLEAAMFGGVFGRPMHPFSMPSHRSSTYYPPITHSSSPALAEQRLLREQQVRGLRFIHLFIIATMGEYFYQF
jgi:hypothetical protein